MGAEFWIIGSILTVIGGLLFANYHAAWHESESERTLLRRRLQHLGLDERKLSDACLDGLVEYATTSQDHLTLPKSQYLPVALERIGKHISQICNGDPNFKPNEISDQIAHGYLNPYWKLLEKHHPELFALDELHFTQTFGKMLLSSKPGRGENSSTGNSPKSLLLFQKGHAPGSSGKRRLQGRKQKRRVSLG